MQQSNLRETKIDFWNDYWPILQQTTRETEGHIDKKVYGITAGGIGIELACLQLIENTNLKWLALVPGVLFVGTLFLNLYSHVKSLKSQEKEGNAIQHFIEEDDHSDDSYIYELIKKENQAITKINNASIYCLIVAVITLLTLILLTL